MAIPILPAAAAFAGGFALSAAGSVITPYVTRATYATIRDGWFNNPILYPEPTQAMAGWQKGFVTDAELSVLLRYSGYNVPIGLGPDINEAVLTAQQRAWLHSLRGLETPIPADVALRKYFLGLMGQAELDRQLKLSGYGQEAARAAVRNSQSTPDTGTLALLQVRQQITDGQLSAYLACAGFTGLNEQSLLKTMARNWPGIADFQRWNAQSIYDQATVDRYQLDDRYGPDTQAWTDRNGYGWKPSDYGYAVPAGRDISVGQRYYRGSWNLLGLGQMYDAINRFAETQPGSGVSITPGVAPFTELDFTRHLRWLGIAKGCHAWMRALAYLPINIRMVKALFTTGTYNRDQLKTAYQKQGFSPTDAESLTVAEEAIVWESNTKSGRERISKASAKLYGAGHIPIENLATAIYATTFTSQPQMLAFEALPVSQQQQTALADPATAIELNAVQLELQVELSKQVVDSVHKQYVGSRVTWLQAQQVLIASGILANSIVQYKMVWDLEIVAKGREIGAAQLVSWYKSNIISRPLAMQRIILLGYSQPDADSMLTEADIAIQVQQQKAADRLAKAKEATTKQTKAALDNIAKIRSQLMASLNKEAGKTTLLKWYVQGIITEADTRSALYDRGFVEPYVSNYLKDACSSTAAQKKPGCQTPKAGDTTPANGQSGSTNGG